LVDNNDKLTIIDFDLSHHARYPDLLAEEMRKGVGSAHYISPEKVAGIRSDSRSDIFSIDAIMYELLTGELPFGNPHSMSGLRRRMWAELFPPRAIRRRRFRAGSSRSGIEMSRALRSRSLTTSIA
jgi:serine/threonine protein kinase